MDGKGCDFERSSRNRTHSNVNLYTIDTKRLTVLNQMCSASLSRKFDQVLKRVRSITISFYFQVVVVLGISMRIRDVKNGN